MVDQWCHMDGSGIIDNDVFALTVSNAPFTLQLVRDHDGTLLSCLLQQTMTSLDISLSLLLSNSR
jgi:hypothetical protein